MDKYNKQFMKIIKMLFKFNIMQIKVIMKKIINKEKIPILLFSKSFLLKEICVDKNYKLINNKMKFSIFILLK